MVDGAIGVGVVLRELQEPCVTSAPSLGALTAWVKIRKATNGGAADSTSSMRTLEQARPPRPSEVPRRGARKTEPTSDSTSRRRVERQAVLTDDVRQRSG